MSNYYPNRDMLWSGFPTNWSLLKRLMWVRIMRGGGTPPEYLTVTGNPVTFETVRPAKLHQLSVAFSPVQSGTGDPSPDNVRPISGWTGLNVAIADALVFDNTTETVTRGSINGDGDNASSNYRLRTGMLKVNPSTKYYFYSNLPYLYVHEYTALTDWTHTSGGAWFSSGESFTVRDDTEYIRVVLAKSTAASGGSAIPVFASDFDYLDIIPDGGRLISITFPDSAGTVYGGTLDVINGKLTVDRKIKVLNGGSWTTMSTSNHRYFTQGAADAVTTFDTVVSNAFKTTRISSETTESGIGMVLSSGQYRRIAVRPPADSGVTGADSMKTYIDGLAETLGTDIVACYKLETPIVYDLTPQEVSSLLGENNVWSTANGDITVTYRSNR